MARELEQATLDEIQAAARMTRAAVAAGFEQCQPERLGGLFAEAKALALTSEDRQGDQAIARKLVQLAAMAAVMAEEIRQEEGRP